MSAGLSGGRKRSVVLLSGGLDSAANLALVHEHDLPVLALTADYGQRAAAREVAAAQALCRYYSVPHEVIDLRWLGQLGGSSLTDSGQTVPTIATGDLDNRQVASRTAQAVWVPNRNGVLIHVAAAYAERMGAERVLVGFNVEEAATFPDNSLEYLHLVNQALAYSTATAVKVFSYTAAWDKVRIVAELRNLKKPFPFESLWSCYQGGEKPCQQCESCRRMARALG